MSSFRSLLFYCCGLILMIWAMFANASIPSVSQYCGGSGTSYCSSDYQAAALSWAKARWPEYASVITVSGFSTSGSGASYYYSVYKGASIGANYIGSASVSRTQTCPSNSSGSSTCTCNSGYTEINGACIKNSCDSQTQEMGPDGQCRSKCIEGFSYLNNQCISDTCPDGSKRASGTTCRGNACNGPMNTEMPPGPTWSLESVCSTQGCISTWWKSADGLKSTARRVSGNCDPGQPVPGDTQTDSGCPSGQTMQIVNGVKRCYVAGSCATRGLCGGTINGVEVCNSCPGNTTTTTPGSSSGTKTTTGPNGESTTTPSPNVDTTTTVSDSDSGQKVTTTTTTTNPDGSKTTETKTQDKGSYCQSNPNADICKSSEQSRYCQDNPDAVSCMKVGKADDVPELTKKEMGGPITPIALGGSGSCPGKRTIMHNGFDVGFDWTPTCKGASWLRPIILSIAWLISAFILVGPIRGS